MKTINILLTVIFISISFVSADQFGLGNKYTSGFGYGENIMSSGSTINFSGTGNISGGGMTNKFAYFDSANTLSYSPYFSFVPSLNELELKSNGIADGFMTFMERSSGSERRIYVDGSENWVFDSLDGTPMLIKNSDLTIDQRLYTKNIYASLDVFAPNLCYSNGVNCTASGGGGYNQTYHNTSVEWNANKTALLGLINNASYLSTTNNSYLTTVNASSTFVPYTGAIKQVDLNNQNLTNVQRLAIGTTTPTVNDLATITRQFTTNPNTIYDALDVYLQWGPGTSDTNTVLRGANYAIQKWNAGNCTGLCSLRAMQMQVENNGAGTVTDQMALFFFNANTWTGNTTNGYGAYFYRPTTSSSGWFVNLYGLYIDDQRNGNIQNAYGVYQAGAKDNNNFNGNTTLGSTTKATAEKVRLDGLVKQYTGTTTLNNLTVNYIVTLTAYAGALPTCDTRGMIANNVTGLYYCNSTAWRIVNLT